VSLSRAGLTLVGGREGKGMARTPKATAGQGREGRGGGAREGRGVSLVLKNHKRPKKRYPLNKPESLTWGRS
jgi:hypothetical protein